MVLSNITACVEKTSYVRPNHLLLRPFFNSFDFHLCKHLHFWFHATQFSVCQKTTCWPVKSKASRSFFSWNTKNINNAFYIHVWKTLELPVHWFGLCMINAHTYEALICTFGCVWFIWDSRHRIKGWFSLFFWEKKIKIKHICNLVLNNCDLA